MLNFGLCATDPARAAHFSSSARAPFQLLLDMGCVLNRRLFRLPDFIQIGKLTFQFVYLLLEIGQALFRCLVLFLFSAASRCILS